MPFNNRWLLYEVLDVLLFCVLVLNLGQKYIKYEWNKSYTLGLMSLNIPISA